MSDITDIIRDFKISIRINEGVADFNINFLTALSPSHFVGGSSFEFSVIDTTLKDEFIAITGLIETIERETTNGNKIYAIGGRDKGRLLTKQPYSFDCDSDNPKTYTVEQHLTKILSGTGITIGRGQTELNKNIKLSTSDTTTRRFCGSFSSKVDAINQLFSQYMRFSGSSKIRWYIDRSGNFRWFETSFTQRTGNIYIFNDNDKITSFKIKEDCTSVQNYFVGFYGEEEDNTSVTVQDATSIGKFGKCYGETITETDFTQAEMTAKLNKELAQKKDPIYSGTVVFDGFYDIGPGTQIQFPDDDYYDEIVFTTSDLTIEGTPAKPVTTINVTSDESAISIANEFDVIKAIADNSANSAKATTGVVTSIGEDGSDRCMVLINGGGSSNGTIVSCRNPGGQWVSR